MSCSRTQPGPEVITTFFMLNLAETKIYVKMPTIVEKILAFVTDT